MTFEENVVHDIRQTIISLEIFPQLVQKQSVSSIFNRIVRCGLDILFEEKPRKKPEG
jgi:hypothetical protein